MSKSTMVRLGDVCDILDHMRIPITESDRKKGIYPYYGANGIQDYIDDYIFDDDLVLLAEDGGNFSSKVKPIAYRVTGKCWVNNHAHVLKPKKNLNVGYLCYSIMFYDVIPLINGTTRAKLNQAAVRKMLIPLPSLIKQHKIAANLDKTNELITERKQQLEKINLLVKSRFIEMFGDPLTNPMGWEVGKIRDIAHEVKYGTSRPAVESGKYKYLRMNNITYDGQLDLTNLKHIDIPDNEVDKCAVRNGDILFNRTNSKELVGKTCVYNLDELMIIAGYIIRIRVNNRVVPLYLSTVLNSEYGKATLRDIAKSIIGQANINAQELQRIRLPLPPLPLQQYFADFVRATDKMKLEIQRGLKSLEFLNSALMQKYFG